jgi:hypothetical protein
LFLLLGTQSPLLQTLLLQPLLLLPLPLLLLLLLLSQYLTQQPGNLRQQTALLPLGLLELLACRPLQLLQTPHHPPPLHRQPRNRCLPTLSVPCSAAACCLSCAARTAAA